MELATIPHNSSTMSTEGLTPQIQVMAGSSGGTSGGQRKNRNKTPRKTVSDSRVDAQGGSERGLGHRELPPGRDVRRTHQSSGSSEEMIEEQALRYGASHVIHLFVPVSLCMAVVILTMLTIGYYSEKGEYLPYTPFHEETDNTGILFLQSFANAAILLVVIILMTLLLIILYKYRCYKLIHGWLLLSSLMLLSIFTVSYIEELLKNYNIPIDYITVMFFVWNWCVLGMICIHWKGPLIIQQFYLVSMSAMMALMFLKYLPDWTVWTILAVLSIWDLVAVLCPKGPLRILVETAQQRNEPIFPALIYSSGMLYFYTIMVGGPVAGGEGNGTSQTTEEAATRTEESEETSTTIEQPGTSQQRRDRDESASSTDALLNEQSMEEAKQGAGDREGRSGQRFAPARRNQSQPTSSDDTLITIVGSTPSSMRSRPQFSDRQAAAPSSMQTAPHHHHQAMSEQNLHQYSGEGEIEERGIKLGLGDFIFYSVLVGKASSYGDWNVTIACYVSILVGLAFTLMLLALFRKALPALPISISAGIVFFFATKWVITPFAQQVSLRQLVL